MSILSLLLGFCYIFNGAGNETTQTAGISGGLTVYLDSKLYDYDHGPHSMSPGFSVRLNSFLNTARLN